MKSSRLLFSLAFLLMSTLFLAAFAIPDNSGDHPIKTEQRSYDLEASDVDLEVSCIPISSYEIARLNDNLPRTDSERLAFEERSFTAHSSVEGMGCNRYRKTRFNKENRYYDHPLLQSNYLNSAITNSKDNLKFISRRASTQ